MSRPSVDKWAQQFLHKGLEELTDKPGRGVYRRVPRQQALP